MRCGGKRRKAGDCLAECAITTASNHEQVLQETRVEIGGGVQGGVASGERVDVPHVALLAAGMKGVSKEKCNARAA